MADYYVDSNSGSNGDTGLTQALAWATIEYAVESGSLVAGDDVWVRRTHAEYSGAPTSHIVPAYAGTRSSPISIIGWPRAAIANTVITSATWTNGSTTVDLVVGKTLSRTEHCGRWITAPNGKKFLITRITDANTLIIDREYSGAGVSGTDGKFQIEADEDYSGRPADVDGWDSDADDLALIDFANASYGLNMSATYPYYFWKNLEVRDSAYAVGSFTIRQSLALGCLIHNDNNAIIANIPECYIDRTIFEGSGSGANQTVVPGSVTAIKNSAIYNMGGNGLSYAPMYMENVNIGVETVNQGYDINSITVTSFGIDVKLGSTNKVNLSAEDGFFIMALSIENYQKVLGEHKTFLLSQSFNSKDVVAGSGDPYKRTDGADKIIEVDCSISASHGASIPERAVVIFTHEFETDTTSKAYRYYVNCKALSLTALELWLECEYVDSYDDTSEYTITRVESDEACALRSGVSDWTQYIEVTGVAPAVASKVRIKCFVAKYDADGYIYIDPLAVVS